LAAAKARIEAAKNKARPNMDAKRQAILQAARERRAGRPASSDASAKLQESTPVESAPTRSAPTRSAPARNKQLLAKRLEAVRASKREVRNALDEQPSNDDDKKVVGGDKKVGALANRFGAPPSKAAPTVRRALPNAQPRVQTLPKPRVDESTTNNSITATTTTMTNKPNNSNDLDDDSISMPKKAAPRRTPSINAVALDENVPSPKKQAPRRPAHRPDTSQPAGSKTTTAPKRLAGAQATPLASAQRRAELDAKLNSAKASVNLARQSVRTVAVKVCSLLLLGV
jgi:hypothetical protein